MAWVCHYVEKIVDGMEANWLSGREKDPGAAVSKEDHAESVLGYERPINIDFLEKGTTVNKAFY